VTVSAIRNVAFSRNAFFCALRTPFVAPNASFSLVFACFSKPLPLLPPDLSSSPMTFISCRGSSALTAKPAKPIPPITTLADFCLLLYVSLVVPSSSSLYAVKFVAMFWIWTLAFATTPRLFIYRPPIISLSRRVQQNHEPLILDALGLYSRHASAPLAAFSANF
jgi:hypothetical protein